MRARLTVLIVLTLVGCESRAREGPPLAIDHPANPGAAESTSPSRSGTLDLAVAEPVVTEPATTHVGHAADQHASPAASAPATVPSAADAAFVCPMHPDVTSDQPNARCPKCGMRLVKKSETEGGQ